MIPRNNPLTCGNLVPCVPARRSRGSSLPPPPATPTAVGRHGRAPGIYPPRHRTVPSQRRGAVSCLPLRSCGSREGKPDIRSPSPACAKANRLFLSPLQEVVFLGRCEGVLAACELGGERQRMLDNATGTDPVHEVFVSTRAWCRCQQGRTGGRPFINSAGACKHYRTHVR